MTLALTMCVRGRACAVLCPAGRTIIPHAITDAGFRFGHSLIGTARFEVVPFGFEFYSFKTYNVLVNPNNLLVQTVLTTMPRIQRSTTTEAQYQRAVASFVRHPQPPASSFSGSAVTLVPLWISPQTVLI